MFDINDSDNSFKDEFSISRKPIIRNFFGN